MITLMEIHSYIMVFHEALYYGKKLSHSLINPNQLRHNGLDFWDNPYDDMHDLSIVTLDDTIIPMKYNGTKLSFCTRVPTQDELSNCSHMEMTSDSAWEPSNVMLGEVTTGKTENKIRSRSEYMSYSELSTGTREVYRYNDPTLDEATIHSINPCLVELKERFVSQINARFENDFTENIPARRTFVSSERHAQSTADAIVDLWYISR